MNTFIENITNMYGAKGTQWLANLPVIIDDLTQYWDLQQITDIDNKTYNYVAKAFTKENEPVVIKITCAEKTIVTEVEALKFFAGVGSIELIDYHTKYHAILLQQAVPGVTLQSLYENNAEHAMNAYVSTMSQLHSRPLPTTHQFRHIRDWLKAIDNLKPNQPCPSALLKKVINLRKKLLNSPTNEVVCHGDLHLDNIIQNKDNWLAIDPQGIIGEAEFEIAAFNFLHVKELSMLDDVKEIFNARVDRLAEKANLNAQRVKDWVLVRLLLMAAWHIEDDGDPKWAITLAERLC